MMIIGTRFACMRAFSSHIPYARLTFMCKTCRIEITRILLIHRKYTSFFHTCLTLEPLFSQKSVPSHGNVRKTEPIWWKVSIFTASLPPYVFVFTHVKTCWQAEQFFLKSNRTLVVFCKIYPKSRTKYFSHFYVLTNYKMIYNCPWKREMYHMATCSLNFCSETGCGEQMMSRRTLKMNLNGTGRVKNRVESVHDRNL